MSGEVSYFSRFFVKFVEIIAAGCASAICAYLLAHFWGPPVIPASAPAPTAVQVSPTASGVAGQPTPPAAAANEHPAPQQDATEAKLAPKAGKDAKALPPRKHTKTYTTAAEKEPHSEKSAEAQARAALTNVDAKRRAPADAPIGSGTRSVPMDDLSSQASVPPHQPDVGPRRVVVPPRPAVEAAPKPADVPLQPVQSPPAQGADLRPRSPADQDKDVFSALKRIPDLLRPDPPAANGEPPRPPMPVDTAPPEYGN